MMITNMTGCLKLFFVLSILCTSIPALYADECKIIINKVTLTGTSVKDNGTATCTAKCNKITCNKACGYNKAGTIKEGTFTQTTTGVSTGNTTEAPVGNTTEAPVGNTTEAPVGNPTGVPSAATSAVPSGATTAVPSGANSTKGRYLSEKNTTKPDTDTPKIGPVKKVSCGKAVSGAMTVKGSFFLISSVAVVLSLVN